MLDSDYDNKQLPKQDFTKHSPETEYGQDGTKEAESKQYHDEGVDWSPRQERLKGGP
jgi:hypothetical protein